MSATTSADGAHKIRTRRLDIPGHRVNRWEVSVDGHTVTRARSEPAALERAEEWIRKLKQEAHQKAP